MKKIFISALALTVGACSLFQRDSNSYWLNNLRNYTTYPVDYYTEDQFDSTEKQTDEKEVATHTYQRNVVVSAYVGQRMVDSQTFGVKKFTKSKIMAKNSAKISNIYDEIYIRKGQEFEPIGEVKIDGQYYMLINGDNQGSILLTDENGYVIDRICALYHGDLLFSKTQATITPKSLKIVPIDTTRTDVTEPEQNFEIIFNGYRDGLIAFTYVDFKSNETNNYLYPQTLQDINMNGVKFKITGIYPDRIEYMLTE